MIRSMAKQLQDLRARHALRRTFNAYVGQPVRTHAVKLGLAVADNGWPVHETRHSADFDTPVLRDILKKAYESGLAFSVEVPFDTAVSRRRLPRSYSSHDSLRAHIRQDADGVFRIKRFTIGRVSR